MRDLLGNCCSILLTKLQVTLALVLDHKNNLHTRKISINFKAQNNHFSALDVNFIRFLC
jgi:hypothetical protein